jgi:hypothetical protein
MTIEGILINTSHRSHRSHHARSPRAWSSWVLIEVAVTASALAGCTTTSALPLLAEPHAPVPMLVPREVDATPWFPTRRSAERLPSADAMRHELRALGHDHLTAELRACVAPTGATIDVTLDQSSGVAAFDRAVVHDLATWQYRSFGAPSDLRVCEPITITYLP